MKRDVSNAFNLGKAVLRHLQVLLAILTAVLTSGVAIAGQLSVSPASAVFGEFPAWEKQESAFTIGNQGEITVTLLRVRSSCACTLIDFTPCTLAPGQETSVTVSLPLNTLSGKFTRAVYLETDAPGEEFLKLTVSGTAVPAVDVRPKRDVYLGRLEPGRPYAFMFRLVPASPGMLLKLLPADEGDGRAETALSRNGGDGGFTLELAFTPDASRRHAAIRRMVAVEGRDDIPPIPLSVMFSTTNAVQAGGVE